MTLRKDDILPIWLASGYRLLERAENGHRVTDDFIRAYLLRPELVPIEESCDAERALHESLLHEPRQPITPVTLLRLKDKDARDNIEIFVRFRDHLMEAGTVERAYLNLFDGRQLPLPSLFIDQLAHLVVAGILKDEDNPYLLRASECLFRAQMVSNVQGSFMLADEETVEQSRESAGLGNLGRLLVDAQAPLRSNELDVLNDDNAKHYAARSGRFDMVLDAGFGRPGLDALARVMERWIDRFFSVGARIQPASQVRDERWVWHIGLDSTSTGILNDLFDGKQVEDQRQEQLISLFRMEVDNPSLLIERVRGRPIYLGLAHDGSTDAGGILRFKPQNLLVNLPLLPQH